MKTIVRTDVGRVRRINEDVAYAADSLGIVCDGMGGHRAGDVAAALAVDTMLEHLSGQAPSVRILADAIARANEAVHDRSLRGRALRGMGTTLTALWMAPEQVILGHVGDSRAYLLRAGSLRQCTHDHSLVAELVREGSITPEQARNHPRRNLITRSLGVEPHVEPDLFEVDRCPGDRWLLCSDGLTNHVLDEEIESLLSDPSLDHAADALLDLALERGGSDNITLILLEEEGGALC
ncbi:MAG: Stp1/IreP family PP2C-type Ser/Thr phosphatase [Oscillospiraceae bacterium]|jgi:protein phosphatase|nr:Stp1/IreP family PP2C-type Ser/Thr phosphatase [Oscillospiraceae bacterium]